MTMRSTWQRIGERHWHEVRGQWLPYVGGIGTVVVRPDPGLERLSTLQSITAEREGSRMPDVDGLRQNLLSEAIFLFHKASHAQFAVARLSQKGMNSWAMFNAYHAALLSAKSLMSLLGVTFPKVAGSDVMIDVFPVPEKKAKKKSIAVPSEFVEFHCSRLGGQLDQRNVWEALQRVIRMTSGAWNGMAEPRQVERLDWAAITPPRNHFLYKAAYWPDIEDISRDLQLDDWAERLGTELDTSSSAFLMRLSIVMHALVSWLIADLAELSNLFRYQLELARWPTDTEVEHWSVKTLVNVGA